MLKSYLDVQQQQQPLIFSDEDNFFKLCLQAHLEAEEGDEKEEAEEVKEG
jgi:hypothetical protein